MRCELSGCFLVKICTFLRTNLGLLLNFSGEKLPRDNWRQTSIDAAVHSIHISKINSQREIAIFCRAFVQSAGSASNMVACALFCRVSNCSALTWQPWNAGGRALAMPQLRQFTVYRPTVELRWGKPRSNESQRHHRPSDYSHSTCSDYSECRTPILTVDCDSIRAASTVVFDSLTDARKSKERREGIAIPAGLIRSGAQKQPN